MPRKRANGHRLDRITTQQQVNASPRDNGRVIPWWTVLVVILQVLSVCTIIVLWVWNTELETQFNRSETRAADLASDLRATRLDLTVCDRDLLRNISLTKGLNTTVHLLGERTAQGMNERDAALQREQRQTDLLRVCNTRCEDLKDSLEKAQRRLGEAEQEKAKQKENEKESRHHQHGNTDVKQIGSELEGYSFTDAVKRVVLYVAKKLIGAAAKSALGETAGTVVNFLLGL